LRCQVPVGDIIPGEICAGQFEADSTNLSYLARLTYRPTDYVMLYAVHSTGFKGGGINTGSSIPGSFSDFGPEKVKNYEIGLKSEFLDRALVVNLAGYWVDYSGLQRAVVQVAPSGAPFTQIRNAASARIRGLEAEITIEPTSRLSFILTGSYTDAQYLEYMSGGVDKSDFDFQHVSPWRGSASMNYRLIEGPTQVDLSADYSYRSRYNQYEETLLSPDSHRYQDGYGLMNARLAVTHEATDTELAFWVQNLFDTRYRAVNTALYDTLGFNVTITGSPRTYGLTATQRF